MMTGAELIAVILWGTLCFLGIVLSIKLLHAKKCSSDELADAYNRVEETALYKLANNLNLDPFKHEKLKRLLKEKSFQQELEKKLIKEYLEEEVQKNAKSK